MPRLSTSMIIALVITFMMTTTADAQLQINPARLSQSYDQIQQQYEAKNYPTGLRMIGEVTAYWGDEAATAVGDHFGHFYYLQGLLYMGKTDYDKALIAFDTCYRDFPDSTTNKFYVHAIAQKGICQLILEDYRDAVKTLSLAHEKTSVNEPEPDKTHIILNLARAHFGAKNKNRGLRMLHQILDNPEAKHEYRESAFFVLAEEWSPTVPFHQTREAVDKYGHLAREAPIERRQLRNPLLHHLAQLALQKKEPMRALLWYAQVVPPTEVILWREQIITDLERRKPATNHPKFKLWQTQFDNAFAEFERARLQADDILFGTGAAHFRLKNHLASFTAFQHIADHSPNYPRQAETLYNIVASAVPIENWPEIRTYGIRFMDHFPAHKLLPDVTRIMVESVFTREIYDQSWATAQEVRARLKIGSHARDIPDFVAGASLFHLDRFHESRVEFEAYLDHYPDGARTEPVRYYLGAANIKQFRWQAATDIFDRFLDDYPNSEMRPGVLYLDALAHFALGQYDQSLALNTQLQKEFPKAEEIPASWNLTGDLLSTGDNPATLTEIETAYQKARDLGRQNGSGINQEIAAYALWKLIAIHHDASLWEPAAAYFDEFQTHHSQSSHRLDALAAALDALYHKNRTAEAIAHLEQNIHTTDPATPQFDQLFGTYFSYLKKHIPSAQFVTAIQKFTTTTAPPVKNWLIIAQIEHLEKQAAPDTTLIENHYHTLEIAAKSPAMPNYGLLKLARQNIRKNHNTRARELLTEIVKNRPQRGHLETAVLALAQLEANSDDPTIIANAFDNFTRIIDDFEKPELYETATIGIARILFEQKNYPQAQAYLAYYLTQSQWTEARAEANFKLARCYEEDHKTGEAIKLFAITYVNFPGALEWSTAAYLRAATLLKNDNRDGDALLVLVDFLKRLGHLEHGNIHEGRRLFTDWKAQWIAQQQAEKTP